MCFLTEHSVKYWFWFDHRHDNWRSSGPVPCASQEDGRATPPTKTSAASDHQYYTDITQGRRFVTVGRPPFLAWPLGWLTNTPPADDSEDKHHLSPWNKEYPSYTYACTVQSSVQILSRQWHREFLIRVPAHRIDTKESLSLGLQSPFLYLSFA